MKRIVVVIALLSMFLWCSTSVLAYDPMEGHYTVSTEVTALADGFYRYDLAFTNFDQGPEPGYPWVGLNGIIIQVPLTATLREIKDPAICPSDPCNDSNGGRYWWHGTINGPLPAYAPWYGKMPESGYQWLWWSGQNTVYPQGTTVHFIFEVNAPPGSNLGIAATYLGTGTWTNYTHRILQGNVTGPVLGAPAAPVANAGIDQTVHAGAIVTLDGSGTDPGSNLPLTYAWKFTAMPDGSTAALDDPASKAPKFKADKYNAGNWVLELVVTNSLGTKSAPATVTISTSNSAPVAEAGPDQLVRVIGTQVQLDGIQSYDENGDPITYQWTLLSVPEGSTATLANPTFVNPTFTPDVMGDYVVELVVKDPWVASAPDTVKISFRNVKPVANAGTNQSVVIGVSLVTLNGSASSDADGDPLTYTWGLTDKPANSAAILNKPTTVNPAFTPDVPGDYAAQLIVNDGFEDSLPSTVTIHVAASRSWVTEKLRNVIDDLGNKGLLPDNAFKNKNMRNTLITKLNVIIKDVDAGNYAGALAKLQEDIMAKTNGCAETLPPAPDNNDWVVTCTYQSIIYPELEEILACITELAK